MTARYGDKTELGNPVTNWGRGGGDTGEQFQLFEDVFTAPGTWTKPATVTAVEVIVVGGGGAGQDGSYLSTPTRTGYVQGGGGGGGGVNYGVVPVSGPVPITVGAGGTQPSSIHGGTSGFGDMTPGFPYPALVIVAGGGRSGGTSSLPTATNPIDGSAGGSTGADTISRIDTGYASTVPPIVIGGDLGGDSVGWITAVTNVSTSRGGGGAGGDSTSSAGGLGLFGYGFGAPSSSFTYGAGGAGTPAILTAPTGGVNATAGTANTGGGGGGGCGLPPVAPANPAFTTGAAGGSGIVIVRYWQ